MQQHHDGQDIALGFLASYAARDGFTGISWSTSCEVLILMWRLGPHRLCLGTHPTVMDTACN